MKFRVTMKDPDTLHDAIDEAVKADLKNNYAGLDEDEREAVHKKRRAKVAEMCGRWFGYGEYLTVEIDTEARTCTVLEDRP